MVNPNATPPKVFISYSHDSREHRVRVLTLADRLRDDGLDCNIDQYEDFPVEGWPRWMLNQLDWADFVLVVCTETYHRRFRGHEEPGKGKGGIWEGAIITQELYDDQVKNTKFIPILFSPSSEEHIPIIIRSFTYYRPDSKTGYEALYRYLTKQPLTPKPNLGKLKTLPPRERKQFFQDEQTSEISDHSPKPPSPNIYNPQTWVGREPLRDELLTKFDQNTRILWLTGLSGVGKTTFGECIAVRSWEKNPSFHWLRLEILDGQLPNFTTGAARILESLGDRDIDPQERNDAKRICDRLIHELQSHPYWIQIDAVERLLDPARSNDFIDGYWLIFLQQCLTSSFPSRLLLTSQALPNAMIEWGDRYSNVWHEERLKGLSGDLDPLCPLVESGGIKHQFPLIKGVRGDHNEQIEFFSKNGIKADDTNQDILTRIGQTYEGHPLVLQVITGEIIRDYEGNVEQYWKDNRLEFEQVTRELQSKRLKKTEYNEELARRVRERVKKSLEHLPLNASILLRRSSVYRRPVPKSFWLAMLADCSPKEQNEAYRILDDRALIEKEKRSIRQHNLIRDIAYGELLEDEATWKIAEYKAAELWLNEYKSEEDAEKIEKVRGYLEAFAHYCQVEDWEAARDILLTPLDTPTNDAVLWQLGIWGYYKEQIQLCKRILTKLDAGTDTIWLNTVGVAYRHSGQYQQAIDYHQQALDIARKIGDRRGEGAALGNIGLAYSYLGQYQEAIKYDQQALEISQEFNERKAEACNLSNLGLAYKNLGWHTKALDYYQQALKISREISDRSEEGCSLSNLGLAYDYLGQYQQASKYHQQHLAIAIEIGDRRKEGIALCNLSYTYIKLGQYDKALEKLRQSLTIAREIKVRSLEATVFRNLAELYHKTNQPQQAKEYCEAALQIATELGIPLVRKCEELLKTIDNQ